MEEILGEGDNVEDLTDACESLMEQSVCSRIRDETVETHAKYTKLTSDAQSNNIYSNKLRENEKKIFILYCRFSQ